MMLHSEKQGADGRHGEVTLDGGYILVEGVLVSCHCHVMLIPPERLPILNFRFFSFLSRG